MKLFWFVLIVLVISAFGITFLYFYYEKPAEVAKENEMTYISVYALDNESYVKTGYRIYVEGFPTVYREGETIRGVSMISVPRGNNIKIVNYNIENQTYYTTELSKFVNGTERFALELEKATPINYSYYREGDILYLNLSSDGVFRDIRFCDKWSIHVITLVNNYTEIQVPEQYLKYHSCFDTNFSLENDSVVLQFDMKYFGVIDERDYIDFAIYDGDCFLSDCKSFEGINDLGSPNSEIRLESLQ